MRIRFIEPLEVSDGEYNSKIIEINEMPSKSKCLVKLQPYDEDSIYEDILLWIDEECNTKSIAYKFFQTLGITADGIGVEDLREEFLNSKIGIEIEDKEAKDGRIFHNIVDFFEIEDEAGSDFEEEDSDDEDFDEDDEDSDDEDFDEDEEEDSDNEELEESDNGFDDFEELPKWTASRSSRRNSNNGGNRRRSR